MHGLARHIKEALLGRQPKVLVIFIFPFFIYFSVFLYDLFPFLSLHAPTCLH